MTRFLYSFLLILAFGVSALAQQNFSLNGHISGIKEGDTLRFERILYPNIIMENAFDIIVRKPDQFAYSGKQEHDQQYIMTYHPKEGKAPDCDVMGKIFIVSDGDNISFSGKAHDIYYCTLKGGIYDDLLLSKALQLEDSVGIVRSSYLDSRDEALARKDTVSAMHYLDLFNNFGRGDSDAIIDRAREARNAYAAARPKGSLYLLVKSLGELSYTPLEESKSVYDACSQDLKDSYYGCVYYEELSAIERLADGQPVPGFSAITTDGNRITENDFKGRYLLIYNWGMCPGTLQIDSYVRELNDRYSGKGLTVLGLTESLAQIRETHDGLPENEKYHLPGVDDLKAVLGEMLKHPWKEIETGGENNGNASLKNTFRIGGLPFFIFVSPDGVILARGFSEAFFKAKEILDKEIGSTAG